MLDRQHETGQEFKVFQTMLRVTFYFSGITKPYLFSNIARAKFPYRHKKPVYLTLDDGQDVNNRLKLRYFNEADG